MRERAAHLALDIGMDLPEFTRHDVSHMDALWELADLVGGPDVTLTPAEAFVLGGAILVHDLAMSRAAHQLVDGNLRDRPEWPDALAKEIRAHFGRAPHPSELASPPTEPAQFAEKSLLRVLHAEMAENLPLSSWVSLNGSTVYMINDAEIRASYGRLIGSIAASHHWSYDEVVGKFSSPIGVPGFAPIDWKVDALLLACLLRTADAAHLDATRTPDLLAAIRNLPSESTEHWVFQSRLQRPYIENGRLTFTAPDGFSREEMSAWWLAYDTLRMVDTELKGADTILLEKGRDPFQVRGVAHVESPKEFSSVVPCRDWEPLEAKIKVGDVASLVRRLGGAELYGSDSAIGLRELLTNACDAVKARESLSLYRSGRPFSGRVTMWIESDAAGTWLFCSDNGIGMTSSVLGQQFLDFGCSSWLSPAAVRDNIGLLASKFEPTGKFGIGFFSVFMMGNRVEVWSRPLSGAPSDTWMLEFSSGVEVRPILRRAKQHEQMDEPGTIVKVLLDEEVFSKSDTGYTFRTTINSVNYQKEGPVLLSDLVTYILPAPQADIWVSNELAKESPALIMGKDDWLTIDGVKLLRRVFGVLDSELREPNGLDASPNLFAEQYGSSLKTVFDLDGLPVGRLCLLGPTSQQQHRFGARSSTVTAGPSRTQSTVISVVGLLIGKPSRAARDAAIPVISNATLAEWADSELPDLLRGAPDPGEWCRHLGERLLSLGVETSDIPMWQAGNQWLNYSGLVSWIRERGEVKVVDPMQITVRVGMDEHLIDLHNDAVVVDPSWTYPLYPEVRGSDDWPSERQGQHSACHHVFLEAIRDAWGSSGYERCLDTFDSGSAYERTIIGCTEGKEVFGSAHLVTRD
ncbi:HD domain-containing protein [Streptomyces mirabilis]|uniref:HD domain-containing protein n=1 Tax=Streptomyces mirabilis TaxID=68239 RepID=UPI0036DC85FE